MQQLYELFKRLRMAGLVRLSKCQLASATVEYLGHVIGLGTLAPPIPKSKDIQSIAVLSRRVVSDISHVKGEMNVLPDLLSRPGE